MTHRVMPFIMVRLRGPNNAVAGASECALAASWHDCTCRTRL